MTSDKLKLNILGTDRGLEIEKISSTGGGRCLCALVENELPKNPPGVTTHGGSFIKIRHLGNVSPEKKNKSEVIIFSDLANEPVRLRSLID